MMYSRQDLEKMKKGDLIEVARELWESNGLETLGNNDLSKKKKTELIDSILAWGDIGLLDEIGPLEEDISSGIYIDHEGNNSEINTPRPTDPEWTDYVMSHFSSDELVGDKDKLPTCDGLRRVFELLIGEIHSAELHVVKPPTISDPDATVIYTITYKSHDGGLDFKRITEGFNVNPINTKEPWSKVSVATAATKAEARALRKGLRLHKLAQEELFDPQSGQSIDLDSINDIDIFPSKPITSNQKTAIKNMANKLNIDISDMLKSMDKNEILDLNSYADGHLIIEQLNNYQRGENNGGEAIPQEILK